MPSLIHGYEYDIFISYRHKDNEYDGWVSEFVTNLRRELHATFKEDISIYFDENLRDGILESHHVDETVNNKIRCLLFIPILSQTYCDENSFAWQHEFLSFNRIATHDQYGREIKLINGNVSSRILPVRIHDLDPEDKKLFENELGGVLRSIDFIYKSAGVNRPLKPNDDRTENHNHTYYRDQINKVANAAKEIIGALRNKVAKEVLPVQLSVEGNTPARKTVSGGPSRTRRLAVAGAVLLITVALGFYLFLKKGVAENNIRDLSIAVLPFSNLSNDPEQEYFSDGITDQIITSISHLDNVKVIARTSVMKYKKTLASIPEIGKALDVNYVLEGSVQKAGNRLKINAQLIRVQDNFHEWADIFNGELTDIFKVQDEVSHSIAMALGKKLNNAVLVKDRPSNLEAYDYFLKAKHIAFNQYYWIRDESINERFVVAKKLYEKAIELDSTFALAYAGLADLYDEMRNHDTPNFPEELNQLRLSLAKKAYRLDPNSGFVNNVMGYMFINAIPPDLDSGHYFLKRAMELERDDYYFNWCLGIFYSEDSKTGLHDIALPYLVKAQQLNPQDPKVYATCGNAYAHLGKMKEASEAFQTSLDLAGNSDYFGKWLVLKWLIVDHQITRAEEIIRGSKTFDNEDWNALLDAAKGDKKKVLKLKDIHPVHFYLLGMKKEALQAIEVSIDKGHNWYLSLRNNSTWRSLNTEPDFERVLEKAKILHNKNLARFGFK